MAIIKFIANSTSDSPLEIPVVSSGLGFYGLSYGSAVPVGSQQKTTWITDKESGASTDSTQLHNTAMTLMGGVDEFAAYTEGTVSSDNNTSIALSNLPNYLCPLNIRFEHSTAVRVQNCKLKIFNRTDPDTAADGVTTYVFEARHPATSQANNLSLNLRSSDFDADQFYWTEFQAESEEYPGGNILSLTDSPGANGKNEENNVNNSTLDKQTYNITTNEGSAHESVQHDWYLAISSEPETVGAKSDYGLYVSLEYL